MTKAGMEMETVRTTKIKSHLLYESVDCGNRPLCYIVHFDKYHETSSYVQFGWFVAPVWYWLSKTNRYTSLVGSDSNRHIHFFSIPICCIIILDPQLFRYGIQGCRFFFCSVCHCDLMCQDVIIDRLCTLSIHHHGIGCTHHDARCQQIPHPLGNYIF